MKHWLRLHWLSLMATLQYMKGAFFTVLLNILVIGVAVCLPLGLFVLLSSAKVLTDNLPKDPQMTIFMHRDATPTEITALNTRLQKHAEVESVRFINKAAGLKELAEHSGLSDILGGLSENPLPDAFAIRLKEHSSESLTQLEALALQESGVESVLMDTAWAKRLQALFEVGEVSLTVISLLFGIGLILITSNSIRMQILTRLKEIEVSKLIGATDAFIRRPFLYFALIQGLLGSLLAIGFVWLASTYMNPSIKAFTSLYNMHITLAVPSLLILMWVSLITIILCLLGAECSIRRHLRYF